MEHFVGNNKMLSNEGNANLYLITVIASCIPLVHDLICGFFKIQLVYGLPIKPYLNSIVNGGIFIASLLHYLFEKKGSNFKQARVFISILLTIVTTVLPFEAYLHFKTIVSIASLLVNSQMAIPVICSLQVRLAHKLTIDGLVVSFIAIRGFIHLYSTHNQSIALIGFYFTFWYLYRLALILRYSIHLEKVIKLSSIYKCATDQLYSILINVPVGLGVYNNEKLIFANEQLYTIGKDHTMFTLDNYSHSLKESSVPSNKHYSNTDLHNFLLQGSNEVKGKCIEYKSYDAGKYKISIYMDISELSKKLNQSAENALKKTMMQNLRHEIRTPLTIVELMLSSIQSEMHVTEMIAKAKYALNATHLINLSLKNYSLFTLIENKQLSIKSENANIKELIEKMNPLFSESAKEKHIEYCVNYDMDSPEVCIDKELYSQILYNLLYNSLKYTFSGCISIEIHNDCKLLYTTIRDTGIGISEDKLNEINTLFGNNSIEEFVSGIGLGLTVTKEIIKLCKGEFKITSKVNEGTVIGFTIPIEIKEISSSLSNFNIRVHSSNYTQIRQIRELNSGLNCLESTCEPRSILIVDDTMINIIALRAMLGKMGIKNIIEAHNGKEAVDKFTEFREEIYMVLMDINMPIMNGFEASSAIKEMIKDNRWVDVEIIAITAQDTAEYVELAERVGIRELLTKPISFERLKKVLLH